MGAPHNPKRYGDLWDPALLAAVGQEIDAVRALVTVSGGWAWHFMTPPHRELKHAHDHKDGDLFAAPGDIAALMARLAERGFARVWTRFDGHSDDFHRYVRAADEHKVIFDVFTGDVPSVVTASGMRVVAPSHLLSLYGVKHSSAECFAVQIARRLLAENVSPVDHPAMADFEAFLSRPAQTKGSQK